MNTPHRNPEPPAISVALYAFGWLTIVGACFLGLSEGAAAASVAIEVTAVGVLSGLLLVAVGSIVNKLHQIENHLRPATAVSTAVEPPTDEMCRCGMMSAEKAQRVGHLCPKET